MKPLGVAAATYNGPGLYHRGILFLIDKDSNDGKRFVEELIKLLGANYRFAHLSLPFPPGSRLSPHPEYHLDVDWFDYPELGGKEKSEAEMFLEKAFNETYARLNTGLEAFVDSWLIQCSQ